MATGQFAMACLMLSLTLLDANTNQWIIRGLMFVLGSTMSCVILPNQAASLAQIAPSDTGRASAIMNALQRTSSAMGVAVLATVLAIVLPPGSEEAGGPATVQGFHVAFVAAAGIALVSSFFALRIHDEDAASTLRRKISTETEAEAEAVALVD